MTKLPWHKCVPNFFVKYHVTGVDVHGKRFKKVYGPVDWMWASNINLFRGSIWGVRSNGTRKLLRRVYN